MRLSRQSSASYMGEHGERYRHVAEELTEAGYATVALDQQGHGRSSGKRGHLPSLSAAVADVEQLIGEACKRYPGIPVFLYGHSMGGNVALNCALRRQPAIRGLILTSPWLRLAFRPNPAVEWIGRRLATVLPGLQQATGLKPEQLFRPGYEKASPIAGDELCHTRITLQTFREISDGGLWAVQNGASLHVPLLLMHGTADQVTSLEASRELADRLGERCQWLEWPEGYHELHNDSDGKRVIMEIKKWIQWQL
jgi:alpha-beta hydrolase superfamily lysophospholipase